MYDSASAISVTNITGPRQSISSGVAAEYTEEQRASVLLWGN